MKTDYCSSLSNSDSWMIELVQVPAEYREQEAALMRSRWFDYRHLLPAQATLLFAEKYRAYYQEFYGKTRCINHAGNVDPLRGFSLEAGGANFLCMWQARQEADRIGCKYDFYLRYVFNRFWDRGWKCLPRPNQIFSEELSADIADAWATECLASLQFATSERFRNESYCGHPDQIAHHSFLIEQVKLR